jgi:hypothetical protein
MSRMLIVVLLISASACAAFAQNTTKITVELVVTNDSDSPVQIMGIASVAGDTELFVSVRNISSRAVKAVKVSTATAAPEGCSSGGHEPIFATSNAGDDSLDARLEIAPSATVKLKGVGLHAEALHAKELQSRYLQVQLGVEKVEFADGSTWTRKTTGIFDPRLLAEATVHCPEWKLNNGMLDQLESVVISPAGRSDGPQADRPRMSYDFSCEVSGSKAYCGA